MTRRLLVIHFTPPGVVGGVESIMLQHAVLLAQRDYDVHFVAGRKGRTRFPVHVLPLIDAARPAGVRLEEELSTGAVPARFDDAVKRVEDFVGPLAEEAATVIAHNAFTLHFSLPLTVALWRLAARRPAASVVAWCHDLSWTNPLYLPTMHAGYPWELLRQQAPNTQYVTVSHERQTELAGLWGFQNGTHQIQVVPNGIDPGAFLRLGSTASRAVERYRLFARDAVLLLPVRITRRKNIELGIRVTGALKRKGLDVCFLVTGPVAPHHPIRSMSYLAELKALRGELGLDRDVVFLADAEGRRLDDRTIRELYQVADVLLFTSSQEGFGLPVLEAGLARLPALLSDIPIFREVGGQDVRYFGLQEHADTIAADVLRALDTGPSRLYRRTLREFRWEAITDQKIVPLLERPSSRTGAAKRPTAVAP